MQIKNEDSFKLSDEYLMKNNSDIDTGDLDAHLLNLKLKHETNIDNIITKNKKLLAILAHDIRGPMGLVVGHLRLLKSKINNLNKAEIESGVENALKSAEKSFSLLENLLNWATNENNSKTFQQEYTDLAVLVKDVIEDIKVYANQRQIKIHSNIPHIDVFIDNNLIKSVFRNIINNAIKNTFIRGEINISTVEQVNYIEISIKDNGIGIKDKIQKFLFIHKNSDLNADNGNETKHGFGLIFCKEIIDLHQGEIGVISEQGQGSEFKFTLPLGPI